MPTYATITETQKQQQDLEDKVVKLYSTLFVDTETGEPDASQFELLRDVHIAYLYKGLRQLGPGYACLDASRPWILFWVLHSLALLEAPFPDFFHPNDVVDFLKLCQHPSGGYGGGPRQLPHLATTYAAVAALVTLGTEEALQSIDRPAMQDFLNRMCVGNDKGGGFYIHEGGEADVRACYTALAVAHMLNLDLPALVERSGAVEYLVACQTYEGGMGGEPHNEAHGGYAFCALAALIIAEAAEKVDLPRLLHWAVHRQGAVEGGFNGRTNKLVDGCYSFWQGGLFSLLPLLDQSLLYRHPTPAGSAAGQAAPAAAGTGGWDDEVPEVPEIDHNLLVSKQDPISASPLPTTRTATTLCFVPFDPHDPQPPAVAPLCNSPALQLWVLRCCQYLQGGLRDKPGKSVDFYHTCYCLSGLSAVQRRDGLVLGPLQNRLARADPLCNVVVHKLHAARRAFGAEGEGAEGEGAAS